MNATVVMAHLDLLLLMLLLLKIVVKESIAVTIYNLSIIKKIDTRLDKSGNISKRT